MERAIERLLPLDLIAEYSTVAQMGSAVDQVSNIWLEQARRQGDEDAVRRYATLKQVIDQYGRRLIRARTVRRRSKSNRSTRVSNPPTEAMATSDSELRERPVASLDGSAPNKEALEDLLAALAQGRGFDAVIGTRTKSATAEQLVDLLAQVIEGRLDLAAASAVLETLSPEQEDLDTVLIEFEGWWRKVLEGRFDSATVLEALLSIEGTVARTEDDSLLAIWHDIAGRLHALRRQHDKALSHLEAAVVHARAAGEPMVLIGVLGNLGNAQRNAGLLAASTVTFTEAVDLARAAQLQGPGVAVRARTTLLVRQLSNLSIVAHDLGNTALRLDCLYEARDWAVGAELWDELEPVVYNLSRTYRAAGDLEAAVQLWSDMLEKARERGDERYTGQLLADLATARETRGDLQRARREYEEAAAVAERVHNWSVLVFVLGHLGGLAVKEGDLIEAERIERRAIDVAREHGIPQRLIPELFNVAGFRAAAGDTDGAIELYEEAASVGERLRTGFGSPDEAAELQSTLSDIFGNLVRLHADRGDVATAFAVAERGRAALLLSRIAGAAQPAPDEDGWRSAPTLGVAEVSAQLARVGPHAVLIAWYGVGDDMFTFVLRSGESDVRIERIRLSGREMQRIREDAARELGEYPRLGDIGETWLRLAEYVIAPVERHLQEGDFLILVPHGGLHGLPLHALKSNGQRLLERWAVTYLPTASALPYLIRTSVPPERPVVIGAHFLDEARAVAHLLGAEEGLLGIGPVELDKRATLDALATGDLVHISAYGFFLPHAPDASGWVLRPSNQVDEYLRVRSSPTFGLDPAEVRRLAGVEELITESTVRAFDLATLHLNARLVTLSACVSGLIGIDPADDPSGVVPALLARGAGGVLATLWLVDADVTATFMVEAYSLIARDQKAWEQMPQAVRKAALRVMAEHPHPYYWAPFILTGALAPGTANEEKA